MFGHNADTGKSKRAGGLQIAFRHSSLLQQLEREDGMATPTKNSKAAPKVRTALGVFYALPVLFVLALCGYLFWARASHQPPPVRQISTQPFAVAPIGGLTARLFTQGEQLRPSGNDIFIEFRDAQSNLVDVGDVTFELGLKMPDLVMHSMGKVLHTATPGQYRTTLEPQMAGSWTATLGYSGPRGAAKAQFPETIK